MVIFSGRGDIFDCGADSIIIPVNCNGVMGAGLAKAARDNYPSVFEEYNALCKSKQFDIGDVHVHIPTNGPRLILLPTKKDWWDKSEFKYVLSALVGLVNHPELNTFGRIASPMLGTGCGKLDKKEVLSIMTTFFDDIENKVAILVSP